MGIVETKGLHLTNAYSPKLDEFVEKLLAKCVACKVGRKKNLKNYSNTKKPWIKLTLIYWDCHKFHKLPIF